MSEPWRTPDGHHVVVDGRRWRATDPSMPESLRKELVSELMAARRAVKDAEDEAAERRARDRVRDAKVALGERGAPWWEELDDAALAPRLEAAMRALLRKRAPTSTICPSDAARAVGGERWRDRMDLARDVARRLAGSGVVTLLQGGEPVEDPDAASGAVRIGRGADWPG